MPQKSTSDLLPDLIQLARRFPSLRIKQESMGGLTRSEYELLMLLRLNQEGDESAASVSELSALLRISPAGVTHLINPLEEKAFVRRLADASDRRIVRVGLTRKGTQTADALIADVKGQLDDLVAYLGQEDARTLVRLMTRALEYFAAQVEE
jgi:DNA-binding MarR family transcriptional regulator